MQLLKGQTPGTHTKKKKKKNWNDHTSEPSASQKSTQVHSQLYVFHSTFILGNVSKYLVHFSDTNTAVYRITALSL